MTQIEYGLIKQIYGKVAYIFSLAHQISVIGYYN